MAKVGRPKKVLDYKLIGSLAEIQCTEEEIAKILDVSVRTLQRDAEFCRVYNSKREAGKSSLRRIQWKKAMEGNSTMLVWLGKQYLGQTDKQDTKIGADSSISVKVKGV